MVKKYNDINGSENHLCQNFHAVKIQIGVDGKSIMNFFVMCKDYIQDIFYSEYTGKEIVNKYGFNWKKKLDLDKIEYFQVCLKFKDKSHNINLYKDVIKSNLTELAKRNNIPISFFSSGYKFIINMHKDWTKKPHLLSMFLAVARVTYPKPLDYILQYPVENQKYITKNMTKGFINKVSKNELGYDYTWSSIDSVDKAHNNGWIYYLKQIHKNNDRKNNN